MRTHDGDPAPAFEGTTVTGETLTLADLPGPVRHVQFHRFAGCPSCHVTVQQFLARHAELAAAGVSTVLLYHSTRDELRAHLDGAELPLPIVGDPERVIYDAWGVERSTAGLASPSFMAKAMRGMATGFFSTPLGHTGGITGLPADFLVDDSGVVRVARYGRHAGDTLSVDEVLAAAADLRSEAPRATG